MYLGAGRECKYSGPEGYRWHKGTLGVPRWCSRCWGLLGNVGTQRPEGYRQHKAARGLL